MGESTVNSIGLAILAAVLSLFTGWLLYWLAEKRRAARTIAADHEKALARIFDLEKQMALLNQAIVPISVAFQAILVKELTHAHTPEMDALMVKLGPPFTLSVVEAERLSILLRDRYEDQSEEIADSERDAAQMLPLVMKRILADQVNTGISAEPLVQVITTMPGLAR